MTVNNLPIPINNKFNHFRRDCDRGGFILPFLAGLAIAAPLYCCRRYPPYPYPYPVPYPYPYPYYGGYPGGGIGAGQGGQFTFQGQGAFRPSIQQQPIIQQAGRLGQTGLPGNYGRGLCPPSLLFPFYPEYCINSPYCFYHGHPYYQSVALNPFYPCFESDSDCKACSRKLIF